MTIRGGQGIKLFATVDSSYGTHNDGKSHTGISVHLHEGSASICSSSKKQKCVTLSSTEAEYVGVCDSFKIISWCRMFLEEIGFKQHTPSVVYQDNKSTIEMLNNGNDKGRTKHIDIRYHYIREKVNKEITIKYLSTTNMIADILTKPQTKDIYIPLRDKLLGNKN
jgi:hypothetical protein